MLSNAVQNEKTHCNARAWSSKCKWNRDEYLSAKQQSIICQIKMARLSGINRNILLIGDKLTTIFSHDRSIGQTKN